MSGPLPYPRELTSELRDILSSMPWDTGPIAHVLRRWGGEDIPARAEAEQAHVLHWLILLVLEHGVDWKYAAEAHLATLRARAAEAPIPAPNPPSGS